MAQGITLAKAIKVFSSEVGCGGEDARENLIDMIQASLEFMLLNGGGNIWREWIVPVRNGIFTFPLDLETPLKWKFGQTADCGFGSSNSFYYSYSSQSISNCCGYNDWKNLALEIKANKTPTQFQPPETGVRIVATTRDCRDVGKKIRVAGSRCRMQNLPTHKGYKTAGEFLTIYHEDDNEKKYGAWIFDNITGVVKDLTCGYVMLSGIDCNDCWYFLSHYTPDEEVPQYTQGQIHSCMCGTSCDFNLHMLGRIQTGIRYIRDDDILPISSVEILRLLAKRARYDESGDFDQVNYIEGRIKTSIKRQVAYQQAAVVQLDYNLSGTGASLSNL